MTGRKPFFRPHLAFSGGPSPATGAASSSATGGAPTGDQTRRFREVILPHLDGAYNFARYLARDPVAAEDIVQEAFLRAFRAFSTWRHQRLRLAGRRPRSGGHPNLPARGLQPRRMETRRPGILGRLRHRRHGTASIPGGVRREVVVAPANAALAKDYAGGVV